MPTNPYVPILKAVAVTSAGETVDYSAIGRMGAISVYNAGPDPVYFSLDATPASAAIQDGVRRLLIGEAWNVEDTSFATIGLITGVANTAEVQIDAWARSGGAGGSGFGG